MSILTIKLLIVLLEKNGACKYFVFKTQFIHQLL